MSVCVFVQWSVVASAASHRSVHRPLQSLNGIVPPETVADDHQAAGEDDSADKGRKVKVTRVGGAGFAGRRSGRRMGRCRYYWYSW